MALDNGERSARAFPVLMEFSGSAGQTPYPPAARAWYAVAILLLALTVSFVDRQVLSLMVQPVRADLGLSDTQISLLHGFAFAIFYTILGVPLGRLADRRNRKRMIVFGMIVWCFATAACGLAHSFTQLFIARIFVGVGEAALSPAAYSMIADLFPPTKRARAMSVYSLGILVGSGLALILGGIAIAATAHGGPTVLPLLGVVAPWQAAFLIVGLPGLVVAVLMLTVREPARRDVGGSDGGIAATLAFLRQRAGVLALIAIGFGLTGGTIAFGFGAWLPTMFQRVHGWSPPVAATAMGAILLTCGVGGVLFAGVLADRRAKIGDRAAPITVALIGVAAMIPAIPLIGLSPSPWLALAGFAWLNFFLGWPTALAIPALHNMTPNEYRGQVTALYLFVTNIVGLGFGPTLVALTTDGVFDDDHAVGRSLALVLTIAALAGLAMLSRVRRHYPLCLFTHNRSNEHDGNRHLDPHDEHADGRAKPDIDRRRRDLGSGHRP